MKLPFLNSYLNKVQRPVMEFRGLDERILIPEGSFAKMSNVSDRYYPAISTRPARGEILKTITKPGGLFYKNHVFYVDGTECFYNDEKVEGLTVTEGEKQIVGIGAYIVIFPDKVMFNTATGEISQIEATYEQHGTMTFKEQSTDSVYTRIYGDGIADAFKAYDGIEIEGVGDDSFLLDGKPVTKVITEVGDDYIVVTASIQNTFTGTITAEASEDKLKISGDGISDRFALKDQVKLIGMNDDALNISGKEVIGKGSDYVILDAAFSAKTYSQSAQLQFQAYYAGSDKTRIFGTDLGTTFAEGDVVTISGCTNTAYNDTFTIRQAGSNFILVDGTLTEAFTQNSGISIVRSKVEQDLVTVKRTAFTRDFGIVMSRKCQDFDYVCEHDNRLWGCSSLNHEIYASKLGDPTNWSCYEGLSTDSYTVTVGSDGDFTGCISHLGYVLFFKENVIHMMYGSKPSNFQLNTKSMPGVRIGCEKSLIVVAETLYYVGRNGVYSFDGAFPTKISDNILSSITEAVSCQQDGKLYLSCRKDHQQALLVYDPANQIWDQEDDTEFAFCVYGDGTLYYIDAANQLTTITGDRDEKIFWSIESGDLKESSLQEKYISKAMFNFALAAGAHAYISFKYDDDPEWHRKGAVHSTKDTTYTLPIVARRCNKFRWKIDGSGEMKLLGMSVTVEGGSELNGTVQSGWRR